MPKIMMVGVVLSVSVTACGVGSDTTLDDPTGAEASEALPPSTTQAPRSLSPTDLGLSGTGPYFATSMFWNRDVSASPVAANSASIISSLVAAGGWGNSNRFQIDFSLDVLTATASTPKLSFTPNANFFTPDCDLTPVPV